MLPIDTPVDVELSGTASEQSWMCKNSPSAYVKPSSDSPTVHEVYPDIDQAQVHCDESGTTFFATLHYDIQSSCMPEGTTLYLSGGEVWESWSGKPAPADWPCTIAR